MRSEICYDVLAVTHSYNIKINVDMCTYLYSTSNNSENIS